MKRNIIKVVETDLSTLGPIGPNTPLIYLSLPKRSFKMPTAPQFNIHNSDTRKPLDGVTAKRLASSIDPSKRTPNEPCVLISSNRVLDIYNKILKNRHSRNKYEIDDGIKETFKRNMKRLGWDQVIFNGKQCLLINDFSIQETEYINTWELQHVQRSK